MGQAFQPVLFALGVKLTLRLDRLESLSYEREAFQPIRHNRLVTGNRPAATVR